MIRFYSPIKLEQSRDVKPRYPDPLDMSVSAKDWGKPVAMDCSPNVRLTVNIDLEYNKNHADLISGLIKTIHEISEVNNG